MQAEVCLSVRFAQEPEHGRARVLPQTADPPDLLEEAVDVCPVACIHSVSASDLGLLELALSMCEREDVATLADRSGLFSPLLSARPTPLISRATSAAGGVAAWAPRQGVTPPLRWRQSCGELGVRHGSSGAHMTQHQARSWQQCSLWPGSSCLLNCRRRSCEHRHPVHAQAACDLH